MFTRYMEVTFSEWCVAATVPPGSGKFPSSRLTDIYEGEVDEEQVATWGPRKTLCYTRFSL